MPTIDSGAELSPAQAEALRASLGRAVEAAAPALRAHALVEVAATSPDWIDAGVELRAGEQVSLLAAGKVWWSREAGLGFGPKVGLWHRVGTAAPIAKSIGDTTTFAAPRDGRLMLVAKPPGEFLDDSGAFDPAYPRAGSSGSFVVAVLVWRVAPSEGLARLAQADHSGLAARERQRLAAPVVAPQGWRHLWRLGANEIYSAVPAHGGEPAQLCCRTGADVGILQYPVDLPFDETARLQWSWRVRRLPSAVAENTVPTHDYLSIAVEFDNGQDLTYLWSAELPPGTVFRCPLPWWDRRETHQVVRSGSAGFGRWLDESQPLFADYRQAVGGELPRRIVAVWLIAVSLFQRGAGDCDYARIRLHGGGREVAVGPA